MSNQKMAKDIIESIKNRNSSAVKKNIENFLYSSAVDKIKQLKTEASKTIFNTDK